MLIYDFIQVFTVKANLEVRSIIKERKPKTDRTRGHISQSLAE